MGFMLVVTVSALLLSIRNFFLQGNWFLLGFSCLILALAIWLLVEAVLTLKRQPVPA
jgi:carbon starvation protein